MENSSKILRRSIHSFLQNYHYFTTTTLFLAFPFSASILISQALIPTPSSLLPRIYNHIRTLFDAAGFPSSELFNILNLKVSQTITSSIFTLPFTITFLLIAKASIFQALNHQKRVFFPPSFGSIISLYKPLFQTYICNFFLIISANATSLCILFLGFSLIEIIGYTSQNTLLLFMSASGAVLFSVILANALVICNMALAISGMEGYGGIITILKACVLIKERTSMALFLALPCNIALAAIEALFQFRVVSAYHVEGKLRPCLALEGIFIAYLYSITVIIDTIVSCMFYKSFEKGSLVDQDEEKNLLRIEFQEEGDYCYLGTKDFDELP